MEDNNINMIGSSEYTTNTCGATLYAPCDVCLCPDIEPDKLDDVIHIGSEYDVNGCGKPSYNVLPSNYSCCCDKPQTPEHHIIYTDRVYDKELNAWLSDINQNINTGGSGNGSGGTGGSGENALSILLYTDIGNILVDKPQCTIIAEVWDGRHMIEDATPYYFSWRRISSNPDEDEAWNRDHMHVGQSIVVPISEIYKQSLFQCDFDFESYFKNNN